MFKFLNGWVLVASFLIGLVFVHLMKPPMTVVKVYPTPKTEHEVEFKDRAGHCFRYRGTKLKCPSDKSKVMQIPVQA